MFGRIVITLFILSFSSAFAMGKKNHDSQYVEKDLPPETSAQFIQDISTLQQFSGKYASPMHKKYFGDLSGNNYLDFIFLDVTQIGFDPDEKFMTAINRGSEIVLTSAFLDPRMPQIMRLALLIHEAAHSHGAPIHYGCPVPYSDELGNPAILLFSGRPMAGLPACDDDLEGAYAFQATFLGNIAKNCDSCPDKIRQDAELYLPDMLLRFPNLDLRNALKNDLGISAGQRPVN